MTPRATHIRSTAFFTNFFPPHRLACTFEYEGTPGRVLLETVTFKARNGKTILTDKAAFQSVEDRDAMFAEDMEEGSNESMERLAKLLKASP